MTTRTWKHGKYTCKSYKKACGKGWEIGFTFAGKTVFTGNFIHQKEANACFTMMNSQARKFMKRYTLPQGASPAFFCKFLSNSMYKTYYAWLDRQFTKYNRTFTAAARRDERTWKHKVA